MSRKSKQKEAIRRVVTNTTSHPGAEWIYEQLRREIPNISMGTVYRNLKLLVEAGEIQQLDMAGSACRFDRNTEDHYHFRCKKCGRVFDLDEPVGRSIEERIAKKTGFKITQQCLELLGLCTECQ